MTPSTLASRARSALAVAHAAAVFSDDPAVSSEALRLALSLGAPLESCAHLYASMGRAEPLLACLVLGAEPNSILPMVDHEPRIIDIRLFPDGASLMARSLLSGSSECCQVLAEHGASMLSDPLCAIAACALGDDGVPRWDAVMAGLAGAAVHRVNAQALAAALMRLAHASISRPPHDLSEEPRAALRALTRLAQLGADFSLPMEPPPLARIASLFDRIDSRSKASTPLPSGASWIFSHAMSDSAGRAARGDSTIAALAEFCSQLDPAHSSWHLRSALARLAGMPGGALSALPETEDAVALRRCCELFAQRCHAPLAIMELVADDLAFCNTAPSDALCARASRRSIMFLLSCASCSPALSDDDMERARGLMSTCLKASATLWSLSSQASSDPLSNQADWLAWARMDEPPPKAERPASAWPLMAAKLAAASDARLLAAF